jgi:SAM-dependent methyltransferase
MQAYDRVYARVYNRLWRDFSLRVAPKVLAFYERTSGGGEKTLLDLCCGTGQLAVHFAEHGYHVVGVDLSEHMLAHARENAAPYVQAQQVRFVQADVSDFELDERFGLAVSTYDALNHLPDQDDLYACFQCTLPLLVDGGVFIFDLNTRDGLKRWNRIHVQDDDEAMVVTRGIYDQAGGRAWVQLSGFVRTENGLYERFEETVYNTAFDLEWVRTALQNLGCQSVHFAQVDNLETPISDPEAQARVFVVAQR